MPHSKQLLTTTSTRDEAAHAELVHGMPGAAHGEVQLRAVPTKTAVVDVRLCRAGLERMYPPQPWQKNKGTSGGITPGWCIDIMVGMHVII
jgi:hypothetical protein